MSTEEAPAMVPVFTASLAEVKEVASACEEVDIAATFGRGGCCAKSGCGCAPKIQLLVPAHQVDAFGELLRTRWLDMAEREGLALDSEGRPTGAGDQACPACGACEPLVEGACSDCGLQLE